MKTVEPIDFVLPKNTSGIIIPGNSGDFMFNSSDTLGNIQSLSSYSPLPQAYYNDSNGLIFDVPFTGFLLGDFSGVSGKFQLQAYQQSSTPGDSRIEITQNTLWINNFDQRTHRFTIDTTTLSGETILASNVTGSKTITFPDQSGTIALLSDITGSLIFTSPIINTAGVVAIDFSVRNSWTGQQTFVDYSLGAGIQVGDSGHAGQLDFTDGSGNVGQMFISPALTGTRSYLLPDQSGTFAFIDTTNIWLAPQTFNSVLYISPVGNLYFYSPDLSGNILSIIIPTLTLGRNVSFQDADGTIALLSDIPGTTPSALTRTNDTNITLTLGGTPTTALLQDVSLTLGWSGTLADGRIASASTWNSKEPAITSGTTSQYWRGDKTWQTLPTITPSALTKTDDTNITLTLGGSPSTSLLQAASITVGWTGTLSDARIASSSIWNAKENALTFSTGLTRTVNTITVNTTQNIAKLSNLTANGFAKTSGSDGTLSIDTSTYLTANQSITVTLTGNITGSASGTTSISVATTIGSGVVTNSMLAGSVVASKLVGTDIATVGTITSGVWHGTAIGDTWIASASTWNAKIGGSGTINTIPIFTASGTLGNSGITDDGTSLILSSYGGSGLPVSIRELSPLQFYTANDPFVITADDAGGILYFSSSGIGLLNIDSTGIVVGNSSSVLGVTFYDTENSPYQLRGEDASLFTFGSAGSRVSLSLRGVSGEGRALTEADYGVIANSGSFQSTLFTDFADVNNSSTTETDLFTHTLLAGQLGINGQRVKMRMAGIFAGGATSTQRLRAYFGGTLIFDSGALSIGAVTDSYDLDIVVIRVSSSIVRCIARIATNFATLNSSATYTSITGLTLSNTQVFKTTGTAAGVGGASNQITGKINEILFRPN